jgi:hypothetical protein
MVFGLLVESLGCLGKQSKFKFNLESTMREVVQSSLLVKIPSLVKKRMTTTTTMIAKHKKINKD